jgi:hypothetical protein
MTWLVEDAWTIFLCCLALGLVVVLLLLQISRGYALLGLLGMALFTGGLLLVERLVVTDRERVENSLYELADALVNNDVPLATSYISPRSTPRVRDDAGFYLRRMKVTKANIGSDLKTTVNRLTSPPTARATFTGRLEAQFELGGATPLNYVGRFTLELELDGDRWLITDYDKTPMR